MKRDTTPWTLIYSNTPKDNLDNTIRLFLSPDKKTIEMQVNSWIVRIENTQKGWQIKQDSYTKNAQNLYRDLHQINKNINLSNINIDHNLTLFAVGKKDRYLMQLETLCESAACFRLATLVNKKTHKHLCQICWQEYQNQWGKLNVST